jgi:hypothetical protein
MATNPSAWQSITVTYTSAAGVTTTVGRIKKVPAPQFTAEDIDVTDQDSGGVKQFISGLKEGNEIEFIMNDIPTDAGQIALDAAATAGETGTFIMTFPTGRTVTFQAAVKTFDLIEDNKAAAISCKVKVSGTITRGGTKQNLSALTVSAGTLYPTFAATTYEYLVTETTGSITVTPTSASATIYVNGKAVTSGQASDAISLTIGEFKKIGILVERAGYASTAYTINTYRIS